MPSEYGVLVLVDEGALESPEVAADLERAIRRAAVDNGLSGGEFWMRIPNEYERLLDDSVPAGKVRVRLVLSGCERVS